MIQIQLSFMYLTAFLVKIKGATWLQGTAPFYVYHLDELRHFPVPSSFFRPTVLKLGDWAALAFEFSLGVLIWGTRISIRAAGAGVAVSLLAGIFPQHPSVSVGHPVRLHSVR
jgi:hypothetical protein